MRICALIFVFFPGLVWSQGILPPLWQDEAVPDRKLAWSTYLAEDDEHILVGLVIPKGILQDQVAICGLTCWLGKKPRHSKSLGIEYPLGLAQKALPQTPLELSLTLQALPSILDKVAAGGPPAYIVFHNLYGEKKAALTPYQDQEAVATTFYRYTEEMLCYEMKIDKAFLPERIKDLRNLRLTLESGTLGRPDNLRGTDSPGLNPQAPAGQNTTGIIQRGRLDEFEFYSQYTRERSWSTKFKLTYK